MAGFEAANWAAFFMPKGTPGAIVAKLNAEITAGVGTNEIADKLRSMQFVPFTSTPEQFADIVRNDLARWSHLVREARLKAE